VNGSESPDPCAGFDELLGASVDAGLLEAVGGGADEGLVGEAAGAGEEGVELGAEAPVVVPVRGSTYCWSPADVVVPPWASVTAGANASVSSAEQRMIRSSRATGCIEAAPPTCVRPIAPALE
jgi:hypothetical protein